MMQDFIRDESKKKRYIRVRGEWKLKKSLEINYIFLHLLIEDVYFRILHINQILMDQTKDVLSFTWTWERSKRMEPHCMSQPHIPLQNHLVTPGLCQPGANTWQLSLVMKSQRTKDDEKRRKHLPHGTIVFLTVTK